VNKNQPQGEIIGYIRGEDVNKSGYVICIYKIFSMSSNMIYFKSL